MKNLEISIIFNNIAVFLEIKEDIINILPLEKLLRRIKNDCETGENIFSYAIQNALGKTGQNCQETNKLRDIR